MNKKYVLFFLSILLVLFFLYSSINSFNSISLISESISHSEQEKILKTRTRYSEGLDLYFNNTKIPYIANGNYYLLSSLDLDSENVEVLNHDGFEMKISSSSDNMVELLVYNDEYYNILNLQITNLPVLSITEKSDKYDYMTLYDPSDEEVVVNSSYVTYDVRGGTSLSSPKKSYKLKLFGNGDEKKSLSLLGMETDADWILNPLWFDNSYVREKIGYDLWNAISDEYEHQMKYIELVIDGDYKGIYCLQERVELDTFDADSNSLLMSVKLWPKNVTNPVLFNEDFVLESDVVDMYQFEEGISNNNSLRLDILRSFVNNVNGNESKVKINIDFDNSVNYSLFINLTMAVDNTSKNQKILFMKENDYYKVVKTPWDLDRTFDNERTNLDLDINLIYKDSLIPESLRNSEEFYLSMQKKYLELRKEVYTEEWIDAKISEYVSFLSNSAISREVNRWGNSEFLNSIDIVKKSFKGRILVLDEYFGGAHEV